VIEDNLMHLEEVCTQLDELRSQNTQVLKELAPQLQQSLPVLEGLFGRIEQCEQFVAKVSEVIVTHERLMSQAEDQLSRPNAVQRLLGSFIRKKSEDRPNPSISHVRLPSIDFSAHFDGDQSRAPDDPNQSAS
jgi:hypothetical protein